jgi:UDP-glucose 4,6-dehydratase
MQLDKDFQFKNILVTGGCGFIFSNFINFMLEKYDNIFIVNIDKLDYCANENNIEEKFRNSNRYKLIIADINNKEIILNILRRYSIDTVVHGAAQSHVDNSFGNSIQFTIDNILGTHNLIECCRVYNKINRFIHMSTDEVYGERKLEDDSCDEEKSLLEPTSPYAAAKCGAEFIVKSYYHSFKLPIVIIRCNNVFGPRQYPEKLIPRFITHLLKGEKCPIQGSGLSRRNFIFTEDVCNAINIVLIKGQINKIYNIGSTYEYSVIDILSYLNKALNINKPLNEISDYIEDRAFNDFRYTVNCERLKSLGWDLNYSFDEGMKKTIDWYQENINHFNIN